VKIAITATGPNLDSNVDFRFGRCSYFVVVDSDTGELIKAEPNNAASARGGAGPMAVQQVSSMGVDAVISGNYGPNAFETLKASSIKAYSGATGTVVQSLERWKKGELDSPDAPTASRKRGLR
jgi:predicted Fe-Mo cluster-binding NifX family protein